MAKEIVSEKKEKPVFDEQALANVLEAAYVLQEHNRELQEMERSVEPAARLGERESSIPSYSDQATEVLQAKSTPKDEYTAILAQIVETQHQIQVRRLDLEHALSLIVERVIEITRAAGASIGILDGRKLRYRASAGQMALAVGTEVFLEKALCSASLRVGDVVRCANINSEFLIDAEECHRRGIQSLIAVPVYHGGGIAGGLEVYYSITEAFTEPDVHSCQLMAGLVTEALARKEEVAWKNSPASERAVMLEALEKLKPKLTALVDHAASKESATAEATPAPTVPGFICPKCKNVLVEDEQFCGQCGLPRGSEYQAPSMQSKVASLWYMQEAAKKDAHASAADSTAAGAALSKASDPAHSEKPKVGPREAGPIAGPSEDELQDLFALPDLPIDEPGAPAEGRGPVAPQTVDAVARKKSAVAQQGAEEKVEENEDRNSEDLNNEDQNGPKTVAVPATALARQVRTADWSSAAAAREFLEQLAAAKNPGALTRYLSARRGDIYLAIAVILVACVIRWGIWSDHSVSATGNPAAATAAHRRSPDADLSLFDRILIKLGLAEAPDPPADLGNPDRQVWVDLQTGLYYCPGADLYGKTPKGRLSSQRDAQLDQFEPASRKACD
jgi:putative methionine-R-sulfoxide reductase with GAF domain